MKRKQIVLTLIVSLLLATAIYVYYSKDKDSNLESNAFAVADTASITKVFIADKKGSAITLTKNSPGNWTVNNRFSVRNDAINLLLKTFKLMEIKSPVLKSAQNNIIKDMAARAIKVEIFGQDASEPILTYYVGAATQNHDGNFMLLDGGDTPYIVYVPGFHGFLTPRFITDEKDWRSTLVFSYQHINEVEWVRLEYMKEMASSFEIVIVNENKFKVRKLGDNTFLEKFDTLKVKDYLSGWRNISHESFETVSKGERDSTLNLGVEYLFSMKRKNEMPIVLAAYLRRPKLFSPSQGNRPMMADPDRMYGIFANDTNFLLIQYFVFDKLMVKPDYFLQK